MENQCGEKIGRFASIAASVSVSGDGTNDGAPLPVRTLPTTPNAALLGGNTRSARKWSDGCD